MNKPAYLIGIILLMPVTFLVAADRPGGRQRPPPEHTHGPAAAAADVKKLNVAQGLEATLFAAEPNIVNLCDLDVDERGRVWVTEGANYRKWANPPLRPEGDRIVICEDTNRDGSADKFTTFYQGTDINSALGICVLGNKVIVSSAPNVFVFTDENGDGTADKKEVLFTGISGVQHDHAVHAFVFGPDGKLYFNFGNEGKQLKRPDGSPVIDRAGNEVSNKANPYRQGMVFRCNLDGSEVETLGWNFRNNYEVAVDSFGTLWQSDNDDDGNRGVRINYVMEFGNFGYVDEATGAGWGDGW
jgi:putative membrane-bound dehydrogenase-like protein